MPNSRNGATALFPRSHTGPLVPPTTEFATELSVRYCVTLIASCRRYGINPHDYLRDVLTRLPAMTNRDDLSPLLPSKWKSDVPVIEVEVEPVMTSR